MEEVGGAARPPECVTLLPPGGLAMSSAAEDKPGK